jgi:hypothetical protein
LLRKVREATANPQVKMEGKWLKTITFFILVMGASTVPILPDPSEVTSILMAHPSMAFRILLHDFLATFKNISESTFAPIVPSSGLPVLYNNVQVSRPEVTITQGTFVGKYDDESGGRVFMGIPYAKPPVGDLRLELPQSPDPSK